MKKLLLIGVCVMMILPQTVFSQSVDIQLLNLKKMFELADSNNLSIKAYAKAVEVSEASVKTAKNALMPKIDLSLSLAYNGNGVVVDRDFSNPILAAIPDRKSTRLNSSH